MNIETTTEAAAVTGRRLGYARVSTDEQDEALQVAALERAGIDALYVDHGVSGAATSRPRFDAMLAALRPGDTVVIYSLSRLSRGMKHLVELGEHFEAEGIGLVSLTESIDTSTARCWRRSPRWNGTCWSNAPMPGWRPPAQPVGTVAGRRL